MTNQSYIVCSTRPDFNNSTYLGQEGFVLQNTTLASAQQYLEEKRQGKRDPQSVQLYRLEPVEA